MGTEDSRIEVIFTEALKCQSVAERAAYLCEACGGDAEVRVRLEALLRAHDQAGGFLTAQDTATLKGSGGEAEKPGTVIGPYRLLEQIGEGGFGVVYMAEQEKPIRRKVALKIIKPGMDTRQVIARFEAERQALALMDHPNIAQVFDAGETATGRPYFVMELVKGIPITAYCDQGKLGLRERLELFTHVCQAVQHAHYKGVIHRDIKPSNVLVTLHDGVPVVKVIDFGIAKATGQELTDKTLFTGFAQVLGTPLYSSPEQVAQGGLDIDTRTDVYSLGVLLYELLTGSTPFEKDRLQKAAYDEMRRIIREEEPPRPSTRVTHSGERSAMIAAQRASQPRRLAQVFRGELDWIVMKALEKDRARRYETPLAFAGDIGRYLANETVQARPPSTAYKMAKFVRRHTWGTAVAAAAVLLLGLSTVLIWRAERGTAAALQTTKIALATAEEQRTLATVRQQEAEEQRKAAQEQRRAAEEQRKTAEEQRTLAEERRQFAEEQQKLASAAETEAKQAAARESQAATRASAAEKAALQSLNEAKLQAERFKAVNEFLTNVLAAPDPYKQGGRDVKVADLLDDAAAQVGDRFRGQPQLEFDARYVLGMTYNSLGIRDEATGQLRAAYLLARTLPPDESERAIIKVGPLMAFLVDLDSGLRLSNEAHELSVRVYGAASRETHAVENWRGLLLYERRKIAEAKAVFQPLVDWAEAHPGEVTAAERSTWFNNLAVVFYSEGDHAKALALQLESQRLVGHLESSREIRGSGIAAANTANSLLMHERYAEARDLLEKTLPELEVKLSPTDDRARRTRSLYEQVLLVTGDYTKRLSSMQAFRDRIQPLIDAGQIAWTREEMCRNEFDLASAYWHAGQDAEAHRRWVAALRDISEADFTNNVKADFWQSTLLREGLGRDDAWATPALRAQVWCLLESSGLVQSTMPADLALDVQWPTFQFRLQSWTAQVPHLQPVAEGGMEDLRKLRVPDGEYLLHVKFERARQTKPTELASWITLLRCRAELYGVTAVDEERVPRQWHEQKAEPPLARRDFASVAIANDLTLNAGPGGGTECFAMIGTVTVRLPPGKYRAVATVDDGLRLDLDGRRIIDSWSATPKSAIPKEEESQGIELDAGDHVLRFEYFQVSGGHCLWLRFEPMNEEAAQAITGTLRRRGFGQKTEPLDAALQKDPRNAKALRNRGVIFARYGRFERAAADFDKVLEIDGSDYGALVFGAYAHLQAGDLTKYAQRCQGLLGTVNSGTSLRTKEEVARACIMGPSTIALDRIKALLDFDSDKQQDPAAASWSHLARGIVDFHAGDLKASAEELFKSLAYDNGPYPQAAALFYLAMVEEHLGRRDQAQALWKRATEFADAEVASEATLGDLRSKGWVDWIMVQQARQEAEKLLGIPPTTTRPAAAVAPTASAPGATGTQK
jgi:serine/threonine protein kinase/tetratricopeptide (TPR) repeat protein